MADFVDSLSDAELRTKLAEYGFPVVPITTTTRKVMAKKLKMLIENKSKINSEGRRSLAKYSSEEESDDEPKKKDKRRMTVAGGMLPPPGSKPTRKSTRNTESKTEVTSVTTNRRVTRLVKPLPEQDLETGSDSDLEAEPEIIEDTPEPPTSRYSPPKTDNSTHYISPRAPLGRPSPPKSLSSSLSPGQGARYTSGALDSPGDSIDRLNQIRSRLSLSSYDTRKIEDTPSADTPFLSNFSKRLSQISSSSQPKFEPYRNDIIKESDSNGSSYARNYVSRIRSRDYTNDFRSRQEKNIFRNNLVSFALIGILIVFFTTLAVMYMGIRDSKETSEYEVPICEQNQLGAKPGVNCVLRESAPDALNLMKVLVPELTKRAVENQCSDTTTQHWMNDDQIIEFVARNYALKDPYEIQKAINNLQVLILRNPKMGIDIIRTPSSEPTTALESMEDIVDLRPTRNLGFLVPSPPLPLRCVLLNKLYAVLSSVLVVALGFGAVYGGHSVYRALQHRRKVTNDRIYGLVERIIDVLQTNAAENSDNFLAVNHVRDVLIPPQERKAMAPIWTSAVKFLEENESRVRTEVQIVSGEEFQVWRWVGARMSPGAPRCKSWQGQAFDTHSGAVNSLPCSPTPCLKVRGMFEAGEEALGPVRDAVLAKLAAQCRVLHCQADSVSGCVYVKCASQQDAATAYTNLHGWWFDGHLVTVKYLRLERYMQRFPDSPQRGPPYLISSSSPLETDWLSQSE